MKNPESLLWGFLRHLISGSGTGYTIGGLSFFLMHHMTHQWCNTQKLRCREPRWRVHFFYLLVGSPAAVRIKSHRWREKTTNKLRSVYPPSIQEFPVIPRGEHSPNQGLTPIANHRLTLDLWLAKDNRFLNPKSSYKRILMAPPCRLIQNQLLGSQSLTGS